MSTTATKKPKPVCEDCGRKTEILKRKGYKAFLCVKCMGKVVKKEVIKYIDDLDHSFEHLIHFTKGSIDATAYVTNLLFYEAKDITDDVREKLKERLKKETFGYRWNFDLRCGTLRNCSECGGHTSSYKIRSINRILCLKCLSDLEAELTPVIAHARIEAEGEFIKHLGWEFSYKYGSVGKFLERGFGSCLGPDEQKINYLAKLIVSGKVPKALLKKMEKTGYYVKQVQPIVKELQEYAED